MFGGQVVDFLKSPWAGWTVVAVMLLWPAAASFIYGLIGKNIVITAKPSASLIEAAKIIMGKNETPKV